jgi:lipopolysaccharide export system permease protein
MDEQRGIMHDIFISDERESETPAIITAKQGRFISDPNKYSLTLRLTDGTIHRRPESTTYQTVNFSHYNINLNIGNQINSERRHFSKSELSWSELNHAIQTAKKKSQRQQFLTEKYERIVIAFAPLVLVLVGVPLGLQSQRSGKGAGFSLALLVFLVYYVLLSLAGNISDNGLVPAAIILWLPNVCFFIGGAWFLHNTAIEKPLKILSLPKNIFKKKSSDSTGGKQ